MKNLVFIAILIIGTMLVSCEKSDTDKLIPGPELSVIMPDTIFAFEYVTIDASASRSNNGEELNLCVSLMNGGRQDYFFNGLVADSMTFILPSDPDFLVFWILVEEEGRGWQAAKRFEIPYVLNILK